MIDDFWWRVWMALRREPVPRCQCCHARNRSVDFWPTKSSSWLCGECAYGLCDFDCGGVPWRKQARNA